MNTHHLRKKLHELRTHRAAFLLSLAAVLCTSAASTSWADALYILTGTEDAAIILDDASKEVPDLSSQLVNITTGRSGCDVTLASGQTVTVNHEDASISVQSKRETVSALLDRLHITPSPLEMVAVDLSDGQVELTVDSDITYYDRVTENVTFETVRVANPKMEKGTEKVVQEGADGVRTSIYEVIWSNGQQISRQFVEELDSTAVNKIVEYGTAVKADASTSNRSPIASVSKNADGSGTLTLADGSVLAFSGVRSMKATAYTAGYDGVGTLTATGTRVRHGTVAVDKRVVPLGTKMYIVTADGSYVYGTAVAEDTGYVGNNLDLYHDTYQQCINFGRRSVTVYMLK